MTPTHKKIGVAATSVIIALGACELILRMVRGPVERERGHTAFFVEDSDLGWRFRPNYSGNYLYWPEVDSWPSINSFGYRCKAWNDPEPGIDRDLIVFLGDSFTSNLAVPDAEVFTRRVEDILGPGFDVKNYGVNGYGQVQELIVLRELLEQSSPEVVIVNIYLRNDFDDNSGHLDWIRGYRRPSCSIDSQTGDLKIEPPSLRPLQRPTVEAGAIRRYIHRLSRQSQVLDLIRQVYRRYAYPEALSQPPEFRYCAVPIAASDLARINLTHKLIVAMRDVCKSKGADFGVVISPSAWQVDDHKWGSLVADAKSVGIELDRKAPQRLLREFCQRQGIPSLDLTAPLMDLAESGESLFNRYEWHWSRKGNDLIGGIVARWIASNYALK